VQHATLARDAVHRRMDEHRRRLDLVPSGQPAPGRVDHHDVGRADLAPVQAARIDEEAVAAVGQGDAEVIADALRQPVEVGRAQREREIAAQRADLQRVVALVVCGAHEACSMSLDCSIASQGERMKRLRAVSGLFEMTRCVSPMQQLHDG
jgi:hypothetical protein